MGIIKHSMKKMETVELRTSLSDENLQILNLMGVSESESCSVVSDSL